MTTLEKINEKSWVATTSVIAAIFLTFFKIIIGFSTGSLGILSEAAHSALDLVAAVVTLIAVKLADKPPDKEHNFGHGKIENFSALIETLLLLLTCVWIIYEAINRLLFKTVTIEITPWSYLVVIIAIIIDLTRSKALAKVAKKYNSQALEADALHFKTDIWSSGVVLIGLMFAQFNYHAADSIAALFVAIIVVYISIQLGKRTIDALLDKVPEGLKDKIKFKILTIPEVEQLNELRIRQSGSRVFVDLSIALRRTLPFEKVHDLLNRIEKEIQKIYPDIDIVIHPEPFESADESMLDKIKIITAKYGMSVHEFEMSKLSDSKYCINLHVESNPEMSLKEAHKLASNIEKEIFELNENLSKVNIHIEETKDLEETSVDITGESSDLIEDLKKIVLEEENIESCSNFSIFKSNNRLKILMDCKMTGDLKVVEVHSFVTKLENKIKNKFSMIDKINIHSEPIETI
jgi:cation diffusion facilitator family transporter